MNTIAVYPGSFDPITNGHLDIVARALTVFDTVIVAVLANPRKAPLFSVDERIAIIREALAAEAGGLLDHLEVEAFDGLTVDFARLHEASAIVRGLRAISDFETEMQLAHNNRVLAPGVDTVFFMTAVENGYVSSSLVKEIAGFGGDVSRMVPAAASGRLGAVAREPLNATIACDTGSQPERPSLDSLEGTPIDIIFLVERLESLIANGKKLPLTTNVVVDQNAALGLIDELRVAVPEEVRAAKRINSEGERIIEKAQDEAERIVARAQEQAAFLIDERGLTQSADAQSRVIIGDANRDGGRDPARRRRIRGRCPGQPRR